MSKANLKLTDNQNLSPDTSTLRRILLTDLTIELGSFWTEAAMDCLRPVSDGMISVQCNHTNFNSYIKIRTAY